MSFLSLRRVRRVFRFAIDSVLARYRSFCDALQAVRHECSEALEQRRLLSAPAISSIDSVYPAENAEFTVSVSFSDEDTGQTYQESVDWKDGSTPATVDLGTNTCFAATHTYSTPGNYSPCVTVTDSGSEQGTTSFFVGVSPVDPTVCASGDSSVRRGADLHAQPLRDQRRRRDHRPADRLGRRHL